MNRFMKEFTSEKNATVFARSKGVKVVKSYDWDTFTGRMVKPTECIGQLFKEE